MTASGRSSALGLLLAVSLVPSQALAEISGKAVFDRTVEIVKEEFYRPSEAEDIEARAAAILETVGDPDMAGGAAIDAAIADLLAGLETSHTARYTADSVDYYELLDVFRFNYRRDLRRMFPPDGEITYDGVGFATQAIDGRLFVTDVYHGGPADRADVKAGDEILAADGEAFDVIESFRGKAGGEVTLTLRRVADGPEIAIRVRPERLQPSEALLDAISNSIRVIDRDGHRLGYVRIWAYTRSEVRQILDDAIGGGRLADADGLILDLRSRWGGAPADAAERFVGGTPEMRMIERDGDIRYYNAPWDRPVVAIIDEGTRSGMEMFANALGINGIGLVGSPTAGAVVAGRGFLLPDDSLLVLAVADVVVGGERLEGKPVAPDIPVPFDVRYSAGDDPQFDAALDEMLRRLTEE